MQTESSPIVDLSLSLPLQLQRLRVIAGQGIGDLAERTGLSRLTVSAAEGRTDSRISSLTALFEALGYTLIPVPKHLATEVERFVNNGGVAVSLPSGVTAPLGIGQRAFLEGDGHGSVGSGSV